MLDDVNGLEVHWPLVHVNDVIVGDDFTYYNLFLSGREDSIDILTSYGTCNVGTAGRAVVERAIISWFERDSSVRVSTDDGYHPYDDDQEPPKGVVGRDTPVVLPALFGGDYVFIFAVNNVLYRATCNGHLIMDDLTVGDDSINDEAYLGDNGGPSMENIGFPRISANNTIYPYYGGFKLNWWIYRHEVTNFAWFIKAKLYCFVMVSFVVNGVTRYALALQTPRGYYLVCNEDEDDIVYVVNEVGVTFLSVDDTMYNVARMKKPIHYKYLGSSEGVYWLDLDVVVDAFDANGMNVLGVLKGFTADDYSIVPFVL